jgi:hypothetical protein
LWLGT